MASGGPGEGGGGPARLTAQSDGPGDQAERVADYTHGNTHIRAGGTSSDGDDGRCSPQTIDDRSHNHRRSQERQAREESEAGGGG